MSKAKSKSKLNSKPETTKRKKVVKAKQTNEKNRATAKAKEHLKKKLEYFCSSAFLRSHKIQVFRNHIKHCFVHDLIQLSQKPTQTNTNAEIQNIQTESKKDINYDRVVIEAFICLAIPWNELCKNHEDHILARNKSNGFIQNSSSNTAETPSIDNSALQELLNVILNDFMPLHSSLVLPIILVLYKTIISCSISQNVNDKESSSSISQLQTSLRTAITSADSPPLSNLSKPFCKSVHQCMFRTRYNYGQTSNNVINPSLAKYTIETTVWFLRILLHQRDKTGQERSLGISIHVIFVLMKVLSDIHHTPSSEPHGSSSTSFKKPKIQLPSDSETKASEPAKSKPELQNRFMHAKQHEKKFSTNSKCHDITSNIIKPTSEINRNHADNNTKTISFTITLIETIVSIIELLALHCHDEYKNGHTMQSILSMTIQKPACAMSRLILYLRATCHFGSTSEECFQRVFQTLWNQFCLYCCINPTNNDDNGGGQQNTTTASETTSYNLKQATNLIRMYTEFVVDCKAMESSERCWVAVSPLIEKIISLSKNHNNDDEKKRKENKSNNELVEIIHDGDDSGKNDSVPMDTTLVQQTLLRTIIHILAYRSYFLSKNEERYQTTLSQLASHYKQHTHLWHSLHPTVSHSEEKEILELLAALGISPALAQDSTKSSSNTVSDHSTSYSSSKFDAKHDNSWPFPRSLQIRHIYSTNSSLRESSITSGLLSFHNNNSLHNSLYGDSFIQERKKMMSAPTCISNKKKNDNSKNNNIYKYTIPTVPILEYSNDDIIQTIFSFLGYKRLARAMMVCKSWNRVGKNINSQTIWKDFYFRRWPNAIVNESTSPSSLHWYSLFREKRILERSIRSKFNQSVTWKFKLCDVVGCCKILRQKSAWEKHLIWHRKEEAKAEKLPIKNECDNDAAVFKEGRKPKRRKLTIQR